MHVCASSALSGEKRLLLDLFGHQPLDGATSRPVTDIQTTVRVQLKVGLIKLELNEKLKVLSLSTWTRYVSTVT